MKYIKKYRVIIYILIIAIIGTIGYINFTNKQKYTEIVIERKSDGEVIPTETRQPIDFEKMRKKYNKDIVGALRIVDEDFEEVVFQSKDNEYYLHHNYKGKYSVNGEIFLDYRTDVDTGKIKLIYGHSAPNYYLPSNTFEKYYDAAYYKEHKYLELETEKGIYKYEIFSVYVETADFTYMNLNIDNDTYNSYLNKYKEKSLYDTEVGVEESDNILILQTCSNNSKYKNYEKKYLLYIRSICFSLSIS